MHLIKPKIMDQIPDPLRHHDRLGGGDPAQRPPIQMIEMSVGDQDQIDRGQVINSDSGSTDSLYYFKPERPDRIYQNVESTPTDQE
jgi:hypothetical protein